nr:glutathione S-transferase family protein [Solimonas terrae]
MYDSPFVRRVAISMQLLGMDYEHRNWSVGADQAQIRRYNPVGRVPTLVLDDGESLIESAAILDYLDERAGPERALLPAHGAERRRGLQLMALATGAAEKAVAQLYEHAFRPTEKRHDPWLQRCREQMHDALAALDAAAASVIAPDWLLGVRFSQADITVSCATTLIREALDLDLSAYTNLMRLVDRCEALPVFATIRQPFFTPEQAP